MHTHLVGRHLSAIGFLQGEKADGNLNCQLQKELSNREKENNYLSD